MPSPLAKKLGLKPGMRVLVLGAPDGALTGLDLPEGASLRAAPDGQPFDAVLAFALDADAATALTGPALDSAPREGLFWFFHPKGSSGRQTTLSRDRGWEALKAAGFTQVASVSLDDTWSGLRFRPRAGR